MIVAARLDAAQGVGAWRCMRNQVSWSVSTQTLEDSP